MIWNKLPLDPSRLPSRTLLQSAALFCTVVGLYGVATIVGMFTGGPLGRTKWVFFPDFLVFYAGSRAFLENHLATVYDFEGFLRFFNVIFADRIPSYVDFRPYLYAPTWALLTVPLALVPVAVSYGLFMAGTAALATLLAGHRYGLAWLAVLTSPAACWTIISGQNSYLSMGLFYGGMHMLERHPLRAGVALGILSYKPQLWIVVPFALLVGRRWLALASTLTTGALLAMTSLVVFGIDVWRAYFDMARQASSPEMVERMFQVVSDYMTTVLAGARVAGLPPTAAMLVHVAFALAAVVAVVHVCRRASWTDLEIAVVATASLLISPYLINYDMLLVMPAAVALFRYRAVRGFLPFEPFFWAGLWLTPNVGIRFQHHHLPVTAILLIVLLGLAWLTAARPGPVGARASA